MRISILGSGSRGNSIYIGTDDANILIDAGLSCKEIERRLTEIDVDPSVIDAVLVTHEHTDHVAGIRVFCTKHNIPVYANSMTANAIKKKMGGDPRAKEVRFKIFLGSGVFDINSLSVKPFSTYHDAMDPVGFLISTKDKKIAVATDLGFAPGILKKSLTNLDAIIIETNYDPSLLQKSKRPESLKRRIAGKQGHLSNACAAELLSEIMHDGLKDIFLAHLSDECNDEETALTVVENKIRHIYQGNIHLTYQKKHTPLIFVK